MGVARVGVGFSAVGALLMLAAHRQQPGTLDLRSAALRAEGGAAPVDPSGMEIELRNEYGVWPATTASFYPWSHIVEPYRTTVATVKNSYETRNYTWTVVHQSGTGSPPSIANDASLKGVEMRGAALHAIFTRAAGKYHLTVAEFELGASAATRTHAFVVKCKYVRRELRGLSSRDLEAYLAATAKVHRLSLDEGQRLYGPKFRNYEYFTAKHLDARSLLACTAYHGGDVFLTAHAAFTLEFEQALQAIDPSIASPYWDYTLDDTMFGKEWAAKSPVFSATMFGSYNASDAAPHHAIADGAFSYLPVAGQGALNRTDWPESNGYGRLTERWNADPTRFVSRSSTICGLETRARLPGCPELQNVVAAANISGPPGAFLSAFESAVETGFHAELHGMVGGAWDCRMPDGTSLDMGALARQYPQAREVLETVGVYLNLFWRSVYNDDLNCGMCEYSVQCPSEAECASSGDDDGGDGASSCDCSSPKFDAKYREVKDDPTALLRLAEEALHSDRINSAVLNAQFKTNLWRNISGTITFIGTDGLPLDAEANIAVKIFLAKLILHPAKASAFATPLAATNDPLFWASHSNWERVWHFVQLKGNVEYATSLRMNNNRTSESLKLYWDVVHDNGGAMNICWGRYWTAQLPFSDFLGDGSGPTRYYSNGELLQLFSPDNEDLPFVFFDFKWDHCHMDSSP